MSNEAAATATALFLEMSRHEANGDHDTAVGLLALSTGDDAEAAYRYQWMLVSFAPFIIALGLRRIGYDVGPDQLCIIDPEDRTADATARVALQMIAEAINGTDPAQVANYTTDVVAAHAYQHGPMGLGLLLKQLLRYSAYVLTEGGYRADYGC